MFGFFEKNNKEKSNKESDNIGQVDKNKIALVNTSEKIVKDNKNENNKDISINDNLNTSINNIEIVKSKRSVNFFEKLKKKKHIEFYIAAIAIGIMLIIYFSSSIFGGFSKKNNSEDLQHVIDEYYNYLEQTETKLENLLSSVKGVGNAKAVINWESSIELILAETITQNGSGQSSTPILVTENGETKPIVLKEIYPKALGVVVSCQGANNPILKLEIIKAVAMLLEIKEEKVMVMQMVV